MDKTTKVPDEIYERIQTKKAEISKEQEVEKHSRAEKRIADVKHGREILLARIDELLEEGQIPKWLSDYEATELEFDDGDLERIGQGYNNLSDIKLYFTIPGLAQIQLKAKEWNWRSATARIRYDTNEPELSFGKDSYWRSDFEYTLVEAEEQMKQYLVFLEDASKRREQERLRHENEERREYEKTIVSDAREEVEEIEEQELFIALKDDQVAVLLMKAFQTIRQERSAFEQMVENANDSMYSMEEHWSRKAADLRRQADDADRRAAQEQSRASDLENDLDDAKKQLKKSERGF